MRYRNDFRIKTRYRQAKQSYNIVFMVRYAHPNFGFAETSQTPIPLSKILINFFL